MRIIVTGGSGFVGKELVNMLLIQEHDVVNIDLVPSGLGVSSEFVHDLTTGPVYVEGDFCFHLASGAGGLLFNQLDDIIAYNQKLNSNTLLGCGSMQILFVSTLNVYEGCKSINEELHPSSPYALSKLDGEKLFESCAHIVRPSNVFGKSQIGRFTQFGESHVIPDILTKINTYEEVEIWGDGTQKRSFLHVEDLCLYLLEFLSEDRDIAFHNVCSSLTLSIGELVDELLKFAGKKMNVRFEESYMQYEYMFIEDILSELTNIGTVHSIQDGLAK